MSEYTLELEQVTKQLGGKNVVDGLSFRVKKGEIFGLLGPNGAGKTTTIRMIVGLISITSGEIKINGLNIQEHYEKAMEHVGAIVENPQMYNYLTGYKNLMQYARMAPNITKERINEVVALVKLEDAIHEKVKTYSLGMRQRLGVAQALLHQPSLLILDEPTNGLDPQGIYDLRTYLRRLTNKGVSVVVSSHLLSEMQLMCDRVAIIQRGKLIRIDDVITMDNEKEVKVHFQVDDVQKAFQLIKGSHPELVIEKDGNELIVEKAVKEDVRDMNRMLVMADISVYGIEWKTKTLEERFLEMTGKGGRSDEILVSRS
ncbi:ABC transporter ATP-binding protein [Fictibacillus sp. Mic-4]|uniref:ABC transporter ATP-binding protein n=1 Tax=Fictibacillus TaxID=1329200 RepID=UPI0003FA36A4|nr:ABC transporter ATP-binding protein [Fictibacillus gelatini]